MSKSKRETPKRETKFSWLGPLDYQKALNLQHLIENEVRSAQVDQILGLEHPKVITLGKRSHLETEIPDGHVVYVDRGGEATLHSEGQLVIYPIVNLADRMSVREWVDFLIETTRKTLATIGIQTQVGDHSGLWTEAGKIVFLGLRVRHRVSTHGLAINVQNDLRLFEPMKSCGVRRAAMDSVGRRGLNVNTLEVFEIWKLHYLRQMIDHRQNESDVQNEASRL